MNIVRKISRISVLSYQYDDKRKSIRLQNTEKEPKDNYYLVHITLFLLGFMNMMPIMFFSVANNYWMYKFRNPAVKYIPNGQDRTDLQQYFQSITGPFQTVPSAVLSVLTVTYSKYITERTIIGLVGLTVVTAIFAVFPLIDTRNWQLEFFALVMALLFVDTIFLSAFQSSTMTMLAKLPDDYLFLFILGQNGTLMISILQIVSLVVTDSDDMSGFIYFAVGTLMSLTVLIFMLLAKRTEVYQHYVENVENIEQSTDMNYSDIIDITKKIWPCMFLLSTSLFIVFTVYPSIMSLVVSEQANTEWGDKYFIPVTVFFLFDVFGTMGKLLTRKIQMTNSNKWWHVTSSVIMSCLITVFYMFCNAQPRTLPVVFDKDWEFILMNVIFAFYSGFIINVSFMSLKSMSIGVEDNAYSLMNLTLSVVSTIFCANGMIAVKLIDID
ncbi:unnamed protein product [Phyllotreta striolata]|uniref:Equilibrative nucleoside transporter 3 n=1 Tax=Phyllotreta striolata TaxID=444603 RepID=A0A9N9TPX9_PHYSR|nr:unnamed protein product [Phyllotreta striolata]